MSALSSRIDALDVDLFSFLEAQTSLWDRRALLALHAAAADVSGQFAYLEIGSYLGGSLQAVMRDQRCRHVIAIDTRATVTPHAQGSQWMYPDNSTRRMLDQLQRLPEVDMSKLTTFDVGTDALTASELSVRPTYCFIDGEHTYDAVLRDAYFCANAIGGDGVIAFHDYTIVGAAISTFLRENWREITFALAFNGPDEPGSGCGVFAVEIGDRGLLKHPAIQRALGSRWHSIAWKVANRPRHTPLLVLLVWSAMPAVDTIGAQARASVTHVRHGWREYVKH